MLRRTHPRRPNGHAGPHGRPNGHSLASVEGSAGPAPACPADRQPAHAASDDASGTPAATAPAAAAVAGTARKAYAAAAPPPPRRAARVAAQEESAASSEESEQKQVPPGERPLPADPAEFVEEIHQKIDLTEVWHNLLRSNDLKIRQRAVERLTDLRYKGAATSEEEPQQQVIVDIDSAVARRAAEGAKQ